ncbi:hypothetical protein ACIQCN_13250 [Pseudarthrobacter sp. NPDC092424]|uniref:hypothetical protein n=1 Tax=Pseudarthrobacter sp. NPDC092424 TaxID=3364415 RepID=UPI0038251C61
MTNQYFPAAAVLASVLIYWTVGLLGGLSLLHNNQPPLTTLTWLLFVYASAALTPLAGALAVMDLVRRWHRNRDAVPFQARQAEDAAAAPAAEAPAETPATEEPRPGPRVQNPPASGPAKKSGSKKTGSKKTATRKAA